MQFDVATARREQFVDITRQVAEAAAQPAMAERIALWKRVWQPTHGPRIFSRFHQRNTIQGGKSPRHEGLAGGEEIAVIALPVYDMIDDGAQCLFGRVTLGIRREAGKELGVFRQYVELVQAQHIGEK